jgi:hypothetical protein
MDLCPHCRNALPESPGRYCPNCGGELQAEPPAVGASTPPPPPGLPPPLPGGSGGAGAPAGGGSPWESRDRLGFLGALVETTRQVLGQPTRFFREMPTTGGIGAPLLYAVVIGWVGAAVSGLYSALFQSVVGSSLASFGERSGFAEAFQFAQSWAGLLIQVVFAPVWIAIVMFLVAGIFHLMLLVLGGARRDFEATFRVVSYAEAPAVLMVLPFCGGLVAAVWSLVLYIIGIAEAQGVGHGKAAAAVLLPLALVCCCCGLLALLFAGALGTFLSHVR